MAEDCLYGKTNNCPNLGVCKYHAEKGVSFIDLEIDKEFLNPAEILDITKNLDVRSILWINKGELIGCLPLGEQGKTIYSSNLEKLSEKISEEIRNFGANKK